MLRALSQLLWLAVAADASRTSVGAELTEARRDVATMLERLLCLAVLLFMIVVKRLFAPSSDALGHACPSPQERFAPSGLKWRNIGETAPVDGSEFANPELASALVSGQTQFTESEWDSFGIASLCNGHYLKAGDSYFKPAERCLCGSGLIFDECHNPDVGCRRIMKLKRNKVQADKQPFASDMSQLNRGDAGAGSGGDAGAGSGGDAGAGVMEQAREDLAVLHARLWIKEYGLASSAEARRIARGRRASYSLSQNSAPCPSGGCHQLFSSASPCASCREFPSRGRTDDQAVGATQNALFEIAEWATLTLSPRPSQRASTSWGSTSSLSKSDQTSPKTQFLVY